MFKKKLKTDQTVSLKVLRRLRSTSDADLVRWLDNIHTGLGKNISEMRKNLNPQSQAQALIYIEDTRNGAVSLLAALQALEERISSD